MNTVSIIAITLFEVRPDPFLVRRARTTNLIATIFLRPDAARSTKLIQTIFDLARFRKVSN